MAHTHIRNPFAQQNTQIGNTITQLGDAIFGGRLSPVELRAKQQKLDLLSAQTNSANASAFKTAGEAQDNTNRQGDIGRIAEFLSRAGQDAAVNVAPFTANDLPGPVRPGFREMEEALIRKATLPFDIGAAGASSISDTQDIANLMNFVTQTNPGSTDAEKIAAMLARGKFLGENDSVSLAGRDTLRTANTDADIRERNAQPRTASEVEGGAKQEILAHAIEQVESSGGSQASLENYYLVLSRIGEGRITKSQSEGATLEDQPEDFKVARLGTTGIPQVKVAFDGSRTGLVYVPRDRVNEPDLDLSQFLEAPAPASSNRNDIIPKSLQNSVDKSVLAMKDFQISGNRALDIGRKDASLFGVAGQIRRGIQNVTGQIDALSQAFGADRFSDISTELQAAGVASKFFDPNLTNLGKMATLTAYQAAKALAQQEGKALSNTDFKIFRDLVGDPDSFFSTQDAFVAGMELLMETANEMMAARHELILRRSQGLQGIGGATPAAGGQGSSGRSIQDMTTEELEQMRGNQ